MTFLEKVVRYLACLVEERFYFVLLSGMATLTAVFMANLALRLHWNFMIIACDTAAYQSAIVNTLHGNWFRDTAYDGPNILGLHTTLVLLLVAPVYALFPFPDTLFILQVCGVYSTVIPLYLVALELLRKPIAAFLIAGAALASPLLLHMAMAPFHPETWIGAAVLWSFYCYLRNRAIGYWISFGFAAGCGEQAALIYVVLGVALLMIDDGLAWRKRYGVWSLGAGLGWLVFAEAVILPLMRTPGQQNMLANHYSNWGIQSIPELMAALAKNPGQGVELVLSPSRWMHVAEMVGLPLVLALFSRRSLVLLAIFPAYFLMSEQEFFLLFHAYYLQFAFLAGYFGLIFFLGRHETSTRVGTTVIVGTVIANLLCSYSAFGVYAGLDAGSYEELNNALLAAFNKIPKDAGVYGPHRFSDYLSNRPNMVMGDLADENLDFKAMLDARFSLTNVHPEQIDYIVCDALNDQIGWRQADYSQDTANRRIANVKKLIQNGQWQQCFSLKYVVILQRVGKASLDR